MEIIRYIQFVSKVIGTFRHDLMVWETGTMHGLHLLKRG